MTSVYVAASSRDMPRAKRWVRALLDAGIQVTSTWIDLVEAVGEANPRHFSNESRAAFAVNCAEEVRNSHVLWLLAPPLELPSAGAWFELGAAYAARRAIRISGDTKQTIFSALGTEFDDDARAFAYILGEHEGGVYDAAHVPTGEESWG